jgi:hypothetical protein
LIGTAFGGILGWAAALYVNVKMPSSPPVKIVGFIKYLVTELSK